MRFRLRTLMIVLTAACVVCGWFAFLKRMAEFHRAKATAHPLILEYPGELLAIYMDGPNAWKPIPGSRSYHSERARDFEHAKLRPWLAFVHCKPGSLWGAPPKPPPIVKRLPLRDDGSQQGDY
jgi:hypothetical protein